MIYAYTKITDEYTTYLLNAPEGSTELCTIDGVTYVHIPDTEALPDQPAEITVEQVTLTPELIEQIKAASPHVQLINQRMIAMIREHYTVDDELFFARIAGGAGLGLYEIPAQEQAELAAYKDVVEGAREWGRQQRAALGLTLEAS